MKEIIWKSDVGESQFITYYAKIGFVDAYCTPWQLQEIKYPNNCYDKLIGWEYKIWFKGKSIRGNKLRKSLEDAKSDAEKLARECLLGHGFEIIKELKEVGMLEEVLSEVGID